RDEGELLPQQRWLIGRTDDLEAGRAELQRNLVLAWTRGEHDASSALVPNDSGRETRSLDPDRSGKHTLVSGAEHRDMVDAVHHRNDHGIADPLRRRELERRLELRRLDRHPENIDVSLERRRRRHLDLELTEDDALDAQACGMSLQRRRAKQEDDVAADPGKG